MSGQRGASRGGVLGALAVVAGAAVVLVLLTRSVAPLPYTIDSTAPDGYGALAELLEGQGAAVEQRSAAAVVDGPLGPGDVVVVPVPGLASDAELRALDAAVDSGVVVVLGSEPVGPVGPDGFGGATLGGFGGRELADTPAQGETAGRCDIPELDGLREIDVAFGFPQPTDGSPSCFGDGRDAFVVREPGDAGGALVTLGGPELLVNARLQPDKENGGQPLDNAALALRLVGPPPSGATSGVRVTFVDPVAGPEASAGGERSPIELMPLGVKLGLVMAVAAFILYAWHRARRLGAPVRERVPVQIAGSELVVAVGDLLRRRGSADRAAAVMRADARDALGTRLGVPRTAPPDALVSVVAARTGREPADVAAVLLDAPVATDDALVRLARSIDELRQEVLHEPVPR